MTFLKRAIATLSLFSVLVVGSLSFFPRSFALDDYVFPFSESDLPSVYLNYPYYILYAFCNSSGSYRFCLAYSDSPIGLRGYTASTGSNRLNLYNPNSSSSVIYRIVWSDTSDSWSTESSSSLSPNQGLESSSTLGIPFPFLSSSGNVYSNIQSSGFSWSFFSPSVVSSIPRYFDFMPFYFPELPHGYFDGNLNVVDGSYNIDFPSNASISGQINQTGNDHYTWDWDTGSLYWYGDTVQGQHEGWISPNYQGQTSPSGDITQTAYANRLLSLSLSDLDSVVTYQPSYNENSRFRCWSVVIDSSYVWFISDTRNKITGSYVSKTSDEITFKYVFSEPEPNNTIYPTWAIVFSPLGEVVQILSPSSAANSNTYTCSCSIGTLELDSDSGKWSVDPLYHGFWFSQDSPPMQGITSLSVAENKKVLANPVFGESAFQLSFLDSINTGISQINSNLLSLQQSISNDISGQTSSILGATASPATQPDTSEMSDYFMQNSVFNAPNTDDVFSGSVTSAPMWSGVTWWSTKFNELIVANNTIVAFTTAMLTLGLAVFIIGRRVKMR